MRLFTYLEKRKDVWIALGLSVIFFLARFPSLFEPNWYGDEGIYQALGRAIRAGKMLYVATWDNKPPTLYYLYAFFDANQFQIRLFSLIIGLLSLIVFFYLCQALLKNTKATVIASSIFIFLFGTPILEGNIANAENFMLLPATLSILLMYNFRHILFKPVLTPEAFAENKNRYSNKYILYFIGVVLGISFTIKTVAFFDLTCIYTIFFFVLFPKERNISFSHIKEFIKKLSAIYIPLLIGFISPIILYMVYFFSKGGLGAFFTAVFLGNVNYVGYQNNFIIPQGLLVMRTICLLLTLLVLFLKRKSISIETQIIFIWTSFSLYSVFFSNRPYPHYLLLLIPTACLLLGYTYMKKQWSILTFMSMFLIFILFYFHVTWTKSPVTYYTNFLSFLMHKKTTENYQAYFDPDVPRDYAVAEYLRALPRKSENIFIWGNSAQIYVLANKISPLKYVVAYHIAYNKKAINEMTSTLQKTYPDYIVILPDENEKPFSLNNYHYIMTIKDTTIYERIH